MMFVFPYVMVCFAGHCVEAISRNRLSNGDDGQIVMCDATIHHKFIPGRNFRSSHLNLCELCVVVVEQPYGRTR